MIYAPILIPTLNRVEHLKRCIVSLQRNKWAKYTDIYISVDYPPDEKYVEGHREVLNYLNNGIDGFNNCYIFIQEKNLGVSGNFDFLKKIVEKKYDRMILSEDDNEFSRNFIEYTDKGLELFEKDEDVIGICGGNSFDWIIHENENVVKTRVVSPYGYGTWISKYNSMQLDVQKILLSKEASGVKSVYKLFCKSRLSFYAYVTGILYDRAPLFWNGDSLNVCDTVQLIYLCLSDKYCIFPYVTKVRNWGDDGSGVNMPKVEGENPASHVILDDEDEFQYEIPDEFYVYKENEKLEKYQGRGATDPIVILKAIIKYLIFYVFKRKQWLQQNSIMRKKDDI